MARILVIEDTLDVAKMLQIVLTVNLHEPEFVYSYKGALSKFIDFAPHLLLIDVWLGDGDGRDLCKEIRALNKKVPIILMSANPELLQNYRICEVNDILEKPFDLDILLNKTNSLLS